MMYASVVLKYYCKVIYSIEFGILCYIEHYNNQKYVLKNLIEMAI